jgi:hypothetical protein
MTPLDLAVPYRLSINRLALLRVSGTFGLDGRGLARHFMGAVNDRVGHVVTDALAFLRDIVDRLADSRADLLMRALFELRASTVT